MISVFLLFFFSSQIISAQSSQDMRTVVIKEISEKWPAYDSHNIEYKMTFPINGGKISGSGTEIYHFLVPVEFDSNAKAIRHEKRQQTYTFRVEGKFNGGDGGALSGKVIPDQSFFLKERDYQFTGNLYSNGKGQINISGHQFKITFTPFGECCNKDLNSYSKAVREVLVLELLNRATPYLQQKMVKILEKSMKLGHNLAERAVKAGKTMYAGVRVKFNKFAAGKMSLPPLSPDSAFLRKMEDIFSAASRARSADPLEPFISGITSNMDKCYNALKIAEAASAGAYGEAGFTALTTAVGAYSNLAGVVFALGEAAKEDWDGFCETNYESEFRRLYQRIYYEGGQLPSERISRSGQQARLKGFMDECMEWLSAGGGHGAQLRKMLIDFAHYKLGLSKSRSDFEVIEKKGSLVMASKSDATVLAALFQAYEQVFLMDVEAERARKASMKRYYEDKRDINGIMVAMYKAAKGDFSEVWPKSEFNRIFCEMYHRLEKEGKLKGAEK